MDKNIKELVFGLNCDIVVNPPWDCLHRHDEIELSFFITRKPVMFRIGSQIIALNQCSTLLFWAAIPHQILAIDNNAMQYYITIPPHVFLGWNLPDSLTYGILNGTIFMEEDKNLRRMDIVSFPTWMRELTDPTNKQRCIALNRSLEARIRRFGCIAQPSLSPFDRKAVSLPHTSMKAEKTFLKIVDYITQNYKDELRIEDIAEVVNMHPNYVISLFRKKSGINITNYILMLRLYESQRLLLTTDMKIIDIAMEVGFGSMSNFYKYFKKTCGKNPNDYRKILEV